jgi:hypothetical protein
VEESLQRRFAEGGQGQLDLGCVGGALGKVVAAETGRPPEGCQEVVDQGEVDHPHLSVAAYAMTDHHPGVLGAGTAIEQHRDPARARWVLIGDIAVG